MFYIHNPMAPYIDYNVPNHFSKGRQCLVVHPLKMSELCSASIPPIASQWFY